MMRGKSDPDSASCWVAPTRASGPRLGYGTLSNGAHELAPHDPATTPAVERADGADRGRGALEGKHLLFVDDELDHSLELHELLVEELGISGTVVNTGAKALAVVEIVRPDLVVLDLNMPGMDGLDLFKHLRVRLRGLPVIVITGFDVGHPAVVAIVGTVHTAYVAKPVVPVELIAAITGLIGDCGSSRAAT
jgi:CheY-like chemotaxis protein